MRNDVRRHAREVAQQVALGERRLLQRRIRGPVDAVEVRELDARRADGEREGSFRVVELGQNFVEPLAGLGWVPAFGRMTAFALHLLHVDVVPQSHEHRRAQVAVVGPCLVTDFGHELRFHPLCRPIELRLFGERVGFDDERIEHGLHLLQRRLVEPRTHVRRVDEPLLVAIPHENGAERGAGALALRESADDEVGRLHGLHLDPRGRALSGLVAARLALADHAFEAARDGRLMERHAVVGGVHELHVRGGQQALREIAVPVGVDGATQVDAGEVGQVEAEEDDRRGAIGRRDLALALHLHAILERAEGRLAGGVEAHDLPVEDHAGARVRAQLGGELRERGGEIEPAARLQLHLVAVDERDHAVAVELGLPHPVGAVVDLVTQVRLHRLELRGHRRGLSGGHEARSLDAMRGHDLEILDRRAR